jgi:uncharacterized membrane protein
MVELNFLARWFHVLFGVVWIGMLYYFNFVQMAYFAEAEPSAKSDAMKKLAPRALWWFRWGAAATFVTGLALLHLGGYSFAMMAERPFIWLGVLMGTFMFLNVWLIIWPNQQIVLGMKEGDGAAAGAKATLASRTNTLFSGPMLFGMLAASHYAVAASPNAFYVGAGIVVLLEINAIFGKLGILKSVPGVVHASLGLTLVLWGVVSYL